MDPLTIATFVCLIISETLPLISDTRVNGLVHACLVFIEDYYKINIPPIPIPIPVAVPATEQQPQQQQQTEKK